MKILSFIFLFLLLSCKTTGDEQSRAFLEGIIITNFPVDDIFLKIKSENTIVSETKPNASKKFSISGPLLGKVFFLVSNKKIKSVSGNKDLKITSDSLSVEFPAGFNYINNLELKLAE